MHTGSNSLTRTSGNTLGIITVFLAMLIISFALCPPVTAAKTVPQNSFKDLIKKGSPLYPAAVTGPLPIGGVKLPSNNTGTEGNSQITFDLMNDFGYYQQSYLDKASLNGTFRMSKTYSYGFIDLGNVPVVIHQSW